MKEGLVVKPNTLIFFVHYGLTHVIILYLIEFYFMSTKEKAGKLMKIINSRFISQQLTNNTFSSLSLKLKC